MIKVHPPQQHSHRSTDPADLPAEQTILRDIALLALRWLLIPRSVRAAASLPIIAEMADESSEPEHAPFTGNGAASKEFRRQVEGFLTDPNAAYAESLAPAYLVGALVYEHEGGPAKLAVLMLHDGTILGAYAERVDVSVCGLFPNRYPEASGDFERWRYRGEWHGAQVGGFPLPRVAPAMTSRELVRLLLANMSDELLSMTWWYRDHAAQKRFRTEEWEKDFERNFNNFDCQGQGYAMCLSDLAVVATVEPATFSARSFDPDMDALPDWLRRRLLTAPVPFGDPARVHEAAIRERLGDEAWELYERFRNVEHIDRRAAICLLRTGAEQMLDDIATQAGVTPSQNIELFAMRIKRLEERWKAAAVPSPDPAERRLESWRSRVIAALHTVRDIGNKLHEATELSVEETTDCAGAWVALAASISDARADRPW